MGRERSALHIARLSHANHANTNFGENFWRVRAYEKGKSFGRFLGAGLPHYGRYTATPAAAGEGLYQTDPRKTGVLATEKVRRSANPPVHRNCVLKTISAEYNYSAFLFRCYAAG